VRIASRPRLAFARFFETRKQQFGGFLVEEVIQRDVRIRNPFLPFATQRRERSLKPVVIENLEVGRDLYFGEGSFKHSNYLTLAVLLPRSQRTFSRTRNCKPIQ